MVAEVVERWPAERMSEKLSTAARNMATDSVGEEEEDLGGVTGRVDDLGGVT
ncbi:hypothetical protein U1Q18_036043, partial [Sarracenia purpurea var. burkii]